MSCAHAITYEYARYDVHATRGRMVATAAQSSSALVFEAKMTELSEEDARKLQDGMTVLNSILSRASSVQGRSGVRQESTPTIPRCNERGMQTLPTCYYLSTYFYNIMLPSQMKDKAACHRHQVKPYRLYVQFVVIFKGMLLLVNKEVILLRILQPPKELLAREKGKRGVCRAGQWFVSLALQILVSQPPSLQRKC